MTTEPPWTILAPVDVNERDSGKAAIRYAVRFADAMSADLTLLNVVPPDAYREALETGWSPESLLEESSRRNVRSVVLPGEPSAVIARYAAQIEADMVLMTTRSTAWSRLRRNFAPRPAFRSIDRPVYIADLSCVASGKPESKSILCALPLDGNDLPVLQFAVKLAERTTSRLVLLHVLPEITEGLLAYGVAASDRPLAPDIAHERLRRLTPDIPVPHTELVLAGPLHRRITEAAEDSAADIVIVGRAAVALDESAYADPRALLRKLECPVIAVPAGVVKPVAGTVKDLDTARDVCVASSGLEEGAARVLAFASARSRRKTRL